MSSPGTCKCGSNRWSLTRDFSNGDRYWTCEDCGAYVNDKLLPPFTGFPRLPPSACDTCTNEGSCKTIGQCLRYKCEFGKVDKP